MAFPVFWKLLSVIGRLLCPFSQLWGLLKRYFIVFRSSIVKYNFAHPVPERVYLMPHITVIQPSKILLGEKVRISRYSTLSTWNSKKEIQLIIGNNCKIGEFAHITAFNRVIIGDNVLIGKFVTITDNSHGHCTLAELNIAPIDREIISKGEVIIKQNVWIGDKVTILPGVTIGVGSIIGANSVVTKSVPDHCIACGNPAVIIKTIDK